MRRRGPPGGVGIRIVTIGSRTDLLITLRPQPGGRACLRFKLLANGATKDVLLHDVERRVDALKANLPDLLSDFRVVISPEKTVRLDSARRYAALRRLDRLGYGLLDLLLEQSGHNTRSLVDELSAFLLPLWVTADQSESEPPVIELSADDEFPLAWQLPLELFPLIRAPHTPVRSGSRSNASPSDFLRFLGMRAIIVRRRRSSVASDSPSGGKIPLSVIAYREPPSPHRPPSLPGIAAQLRFFQMQKRAFDLADDAIWPPTEFLDEDNAVDELSAIMTRMQGGGLAGEVAGRPVLHFCCHYRSGEFQATPKLGLTTQVDVGITALRGQLAQHDPAPPEFAARPLVFLNACRSADWNRRDDSLLRLLFHRGYCHVIGGETQLPDLVAGEFAKQVYSAAIRGHTVGRAVWMARRYLLERFNNPGGLLYTIYGSPDIRLH